MKQYTWGSDNGTAITFECGSSKLRMSVDEDGAMRATITAGVGPSFVDTSFFLTPDQRESLKLWLDKPLPTCPVCEGYADKFGPCGRCERAKEPMRVATRGDTTMITLDHCADSLRPLPYEGLRYLKQMGVETIRWAVYFDDLFPAPNKSNRERTDHDIEVLTKLGFRILANPMWLHRHITSGVPIHERYAQRAHGDQPYFHYPNFPKIDYGLIYEYAAQFGEWYGSAIEYISMWNEPGILDFYPQKDAPPSYVEAARLPLYGGMWSSFMQGYKDTSPGTLIVGPDSESPGNLELFLQLEREYTTKYRYWPRYDILSAHLYNRDHVKGVNPLTVAGVLERAEDYKQVLFRNGAFGRPFWNTEFASEIGDPTLDVYKALRKEHPWINRHFAYLAGQWFEGGIEGWDRGEFRPNRAYNQMRAHIKDEKRRSARA